LLFSFENCQIDVGAQVWVAKADYLYSNLILPGIFEKGKKFKDQDI